MATHHQPAHHKKGIARKIFFLCSVVFVLLFFWGAWNVYGFIDNLPNPERITERTVAQSTKIFDRTGEVLLYEIHGEERRTVIPLDQIPDLVKHTTLVAEDIHFYEHSGIDFKGILRALWVNLRKGGITQGGSTITQQLVKKALLSDERTYTRKIKEIILSLLLEKKYTKDEILGLYLNQIPYGANAYGISAAAETYFGKKVGDLTIIEAATLAALPNAPTYYSPYGSHREELTQRTNWILDRMTESNYITKEQAADAKKTKVSFSLPNKGIRAPHFVMYIREYLNEKYGEQFVESGGLRVITTLDWKLQQEAERIIAEGAAKNEKLVQGKNASLVAINPKTGEIITMVGSRDYFDIKNDGNVNVALRPRQPGSAFKPFVYATAFKKGYLPETVLFDAFTEFNPNCNPDGTPGPRIKDEKSCYHPGNYDDKFRGPVDLRHAIAQSLNVPSVKLLYLAGVQDSIDTAQQMGISTLTDPQRYGLSLVLGGAEVTLLDITSAFGAFAQDGILHPKTGILEIKNADGVIMEQKENSSLPVLDTEIARTINDVLSDNDARVPVFNPRSSLYFSDRKVAAKTGTTQDYRDAWTIGYTPSLAAGVWVGNNDNAAMNHDGLSVMVAAPIWHAFMEVALKNHPAEDFTPPEKQHTEKPILNGTYRAGTVIKIDKLSLKLATAFTPPELIKEIGTGEIRSILAYVNKNNPEGDIPSNPYDDPQYNNWQAGIASWLSLNALIDTLPPSEYDDIHTPEKTPHASFIIPTGDTISKSEFHDIAITIQSSYPLQEIQLFLNNGLYDSKTKPITTQEIHFRLEDELPIGPIPVKIIIYDEMRNKTVIEKTITITE